MDRLSTSDYWDNFFQQTYRERACDWYCPSEAIVEIILKECPPARRMVRRTLAETEQEEKTSAELPLTYVLHVGCGSSSLGEDLVKAGYDRVENIDFSKKIVTAMMKQQQVEQEKHKLPPDAADKCVYRHMDVRKLQYSTASFRVMLEKGTLDCVSLGGAEAVHSMLQELSRVLAPGGKLFLLSVHPPATRLPQLQRPDYAWQVSYQALPYAPPEAPEETATHLYIMSSTSACVGTAPHGLDIRARDLLQRFFRKQSQRAEAYSTWARGFKSYKEAEGKDEGAFQSMCVVVTKQFVAISQGVKQLINELDALQCGTLAGKLRGVQEQERIKLELTVRLQLWETDYTVLQDNGNDPEYLMHWRGDKQQMGTVVMRINELLEEIQDSL